jgi:hypothetical protein
MPSTGLRDDGWTGTVWGRDDDGAEGDPVQITDRGGAGGREFRDKNPLMVGHRDRDGPWRPDVDEAFAPGACVAEPRNEDGLTRTFVQVGAMGGWKRAHGLDWPPLIHH